MTGIGWRIVGLLLLAAAVVGSAATFADLISAARATPTDPATRTLTRDDLIRQICRFVTWIAFGVVAFGMMIHDYRDRPSPDVDHLAVAICIAAAALLTTTIVGLRSRLSVNGQTTREAFRLPRRKEGTEPDDDDS